jgi:hypothetical protein
MISRLAAWIRRRRTGTKALLAVSAALTALVVLYVSARLMQYASVSGTSAGLFVPEGADVVVRIHGGARHWARLQETELWRVFRRKIQKDPAVRGFLNEILAQAGAPTLDELDDRRWIDRNPMMGEDALLRFAGRDVLIAASESKFCVATRIGPGDYLLLPALNLFPGLAGAERADAAGAPVFRRGDFFLGVQGAIVLVSNDLPFLTSALRRRGSADAPPGLLRATLRMDAFRPWVVGFPAGGFLAFADFEKCAQLEVDVDVAGPDLVVRARGEGLEPHRTEPAPVDTIRLIPANGLGAVLTNVEAGRFWDWVLRIGSRRARPDETDLDRFAREHFWEIVDVLASRKFGEEVVSKLDGPVSVLFGASEGSNGRTYAAAALYLRSSRPREAAEALQAIIDRAIEELKIRPVAEDAEIAGCPVRSYSYNPDVLGWNNYLCATYAVTSDALIVANNLGFLSAALRCFARQEPSMDSQLYWEQGLRRHQLLGLKKVMAPGATASLFLYGPAIRQGLEGFYETMATRTVDKLVPRPKLRAELQAQAAREGHPVGARELDDQVDRVLKERSRTMEEKLRGRARILDYLKWIAFQADPAPGGMKLELVVEVKDR